MRGTGHGVAVGVLLSSLPHAASGSTAIAPITAATLRYVLTDTREIERDRGERVLAAARTLGEAFVMAHAAAFDDVRRAVADFGPRATVITVAESLRPHVVAPRWSASTVSPC